MIDLSEEELKKATLAKNNFQHYASKFLKIKTKTGETLPFIFNRPQEYLNAKIEEQFKLTGRVRALILKGRQEGCTTFIQGRFFHKACFKDGASIGTLTHLDDTTVKFNEMVNRFHDNLPPKLKPYLSTNNKKKIKFAGINSEWDFGTAGSGNVGRGGTLQFFHGSEVAFWPRPQKIRSGVMQAVANLENTEVYLETTANGMDPIFYPLYIEAMRGENNYMPVFIPWFWMPEYREPIGKEFVLTDDEIKLKKLYKLDNEQINFRRSKIKELGTVHEFRKEYPCNAIEAFQVSGDSYIPNDMIVAARNKVLERFEYQDAPLILGIDVSRIRDRCTFTFRKGRKWLKTIVYDPKKREIRDGSKVIGNFEKLTKNYLQAVTSAYITNYGVDQCNIDITEGYGQAILEGLHSLSNQFKKIVHGVDFRTSADNPIRFANKRAEMWERLMTWFCADDGEVQIPDDDAIHADIACMPRPENTVNHRIIMQDKDVIRKKYSISPDIGDSAALTFAFLIPATHNDSMSRIKRLNKNASSVTTLRKKRSKETSGFNPGNIFANK